MGCSSSAIESDTRHEKANENLSEKKKLPKAESFQQQNSINLDSNGDDILIGSNFVRESKQSIKSTYSFLEKLGAGAFGTVYKIKHKKLGHIRAVKVLSKEALKSQMDDNDQTFIQEISILSKLDHPNIIKIFDYYTDNKNYYVVNELAAGGELYDQIVNLQFFTENNAAIIMKQLLSAVYYLHSNNIVHRDLKPENILMETSKVGDYTIKLIDFGAAVSYTKHKMKEVTGTPYYIAPEVLKNSYTNKCDLWSCGVILYILLCGYPPFNAPSEAEILALVEKGDYNFEGSEWDNVSRAAKDFVKRLMTYDPKKRLSAQEALQDPWLIKNATEKEIKNDSKTKTALDNLRKFAAKQKLQQASIAFIVHQMSTNEYAKELRELFKSMDVSGDGRLTIDELKSGYEKHFKGLTFTDKEYEEMMNNLDSDKSGYIEYEEFLRATMKIENVLTDKNLEIAFNFFDEDKSGNLEPSEIKKALGISPSDTKQGEVLKKLIGEIDSNNDGVVSIEEFKQLMRKVLSSK